MILLFSDSAKERAYGKKAWLENLTEADEGFKDDLKPDPQIPGAKVFDGDGNYPQRFGQGAVPIPKVPSRVAMYVGGDSDNCFAVENEVYKWQDWQYMNAYCALRAVSCYLVSTAIADARLA